MGYPPQFLIQTPPQWWEWDPLTCLQFPLPEELQEPLPAWNP